MNDSKIKPILKSAHKNDLSEIAALYKSAIGQQGCTWSADYPTEDDMHNDFESNCLFSLYLGEKLIGAVSVEPKNELDDIKIWKISDGTHREIARVVISKEYQGMGYSKTMLSQLFELLSYGGYKSIHLLVCVDNVAAIKLYRSLGFEFIDECYRYGHDFYVCEKILNIF